MMAVQNIVLIGSGRVATQLGKRLAEKGKFIVQVYSRTQAHAAQLAGQLGSEPIHDPEKIRHDADLYIISVSDDAIPEIAAKLRFEGKPVAHTSGSVPMDAVSAISANYGVFYPLQTFVKNRDVDFNDIPLCIEGADPETENLLTGLAYEISNDVRIINSEQRLKIHIAAVFASNFTNFMYLMGEDVLKNAGVEFDILLPLIRETAAKMNSAMPHEAQTGPAMRGDEKVIRKHLKMLAGDPEKQAIYRQLSGHITTYFASQKKRKA